MANQKFQLSIFNSIYSFALISTTNLPNTVTRLDQLYTWALDQHVDTSNNVIYVVVIPIYQQLTFYEVPIQTW